MDKIEELMQIARDAQRFGSVERQLLMETSELQIEKSTAVNTLMNPKRTIRTPLGIVVAPESMSPEEIERRLNTPYGL